MNITQQQPPKKFTSMTCISSGVDIDRVLASIAVHGIVTTRGALANGLKRHHLQTRAQRNRIFRVHSGVYSLGHRELSNEARAIAAILAVGSDALGTAATAAWLLGMQRRPPDVIEVLVPRRHLGLDGIKVRSTAALARQDATTRRHIPITNVERTLVEMAPDCAPYQLANMMHEAAFRRSLNMRRLEQVARRFRNRTGNRNLVRAIELHRRGDAGTMSQLEARLIALLHAAGIPIDRVNVLISLDDGGHPLRVDLVWLDEMVCVEVDGWGHRRARTQRQDADRDRRLRAAGYTVIRITAAMIDHEPQVVTTLISTALTHATPL